jgi:hypothetical protein
MSIKTRLARLEQRAAASVVGEQLEVQIWMPDNGRDAPPPSVEEQRARGKKVIVYVPGRDDHYLPSD